MTDTTTRIEVTFPGGRRVDAQLGDQVIHTDQSKAHGGQGSAPEPFDLFLAALATCAGLYVLVFCQNRGIATDGLSFVQEQFSVDGKLRRVRLNITLPADFPVKYIDAVRAAANGCRVKKTLLDPPELEVVTTMASLATAANQ